MYSVHTQLSSRQRLVISPAAAIVEAAKAVVSSHWHSVRFSKFSPTVVLFFNRRLIGENGLKFWAKFSTEDDDDEEEEAIFVYSTVINYWLWINFS